jgi:hypothetical protein
MQRSGNDLTLGLIIAIALIDAVLLAIVRLRYDQAHGYELPARARAVAKPAPT